MPYRREKRDMQVTVEKRVTVYTCDVCRTEAVVPEDFEQTDYSAVVGWCQLADFGRDGTPPPAQFFCSRECLRAFVRADSELAAA